MKVVFLDRDGVINENRSDYVKSWSEFEFLPGALGAIQRLHEAGWTTIVITNQSAINRGIVARSSVEEINRRMVEVVGHHGGRIDAVLYCPHRPDENCNCRKPHPGLLLEAADRFGLDLEKCYLIGDALTDIEAGQAAGCKSILVKTGRGKQQSATAAIDGPYNPLPEASDLAAAVDWILQDARHKTT